jgi:GTP:adenosylcobinamide-phosphate guanylyltransferase
VSVLKADVYTLKTDTSTLKNDVSVIRVNQNKLIADVSVLKEHDASSILSVVSDSSFITVATVNKVVKIGADFTNVFSDGFMQDDEGKISLAWNKYEE